LSLPAKATTPCELADDRQVSLAPMEPIERGRFGDHSAEDRRPSCHARPAASNEAAGMS
jgi:hypothetical protein